LGVQTFGNLTPLRALLPGLTGQPMDDVQKHFIIRYLIARARLRRGRGSPSLTVVEHELAIDRLAEDIRGPAAAVAIMKDDLAYWPTIPTDDLWHPRTR
jgi:hypothetical protein